MPVAISDDRDEQLARDQDTRIVRRAVDGNIVTNDRTVHHGRNL